MPTPTDVSSANVEALRESRTEQKRAQLAAAPLVEDLEPTAVSEQGVKATAPAVEIPAGPSATARSDANLRAGPGAGFDVIGGISRGAQVRVTGRDPTGQWWQIDAPGIAPGTGQAWISGQLVDVRDAGAVGVVEPAPTQPPVATATQPLSRQPPAAQPPTAQPPARQAGEKWTLVADSAADFPGGASHNNWYYLWTDGRNNFYWQNMGRAGNTNDDCYRDAGGRNLEVCRDTIKANPAGDVGVQWKANRGGTYRFEWDSPSLKFYQHAGFVGSKGAGSELPYSATVEGVIDWEMFFWVPQASTSYHIRVYRLEQ